MLEKYLMEQLDLDPYEPHYPDAEYVRAHKLLSMTDNNFRKCIEDLICERISADEYETVLGELGNDALKLDQDEAYEIRRMLNIPERKMYTVAVRDKQNDYLHTMVSAFTTKERADDFENRLRNDFKCLGISGQMEIIRDCVFPNLTYDDEWIRAMYSGKKV